MAKKRRFDFTKKNKRSGKVENGRGTEQMFLVFLR